MATTNIENYRPLDHAKATIRDVKESSDFHDHLREDARTAFSKSALALAILETSTEGEKSRDGHHLAIAAHVNGFIQGNFALRRLANETNQRDGDIDTVDERVELTAEQRQRRSDAVDAIIPFNHAVKEYIEQDPSATFCDTVEYAMAIFTLTNASILRAKPDNGKSILDFARTQVREAINGMRHEKAVVEMLGAEYRASGNVSLQEDKQGCDLHIIHPGDRRVYSIDAKASRTNAQRTRSKMPRRSHAVIWSTLADEDFERNGFSLSEETFAVHRRLLIKELDDELAQLREIAYRRQKSPRR
jgi:hypothetical protein